MAIIRKGMWAVSSGKIGIVAELGNTVEFHEVNEIGETVAVHQLPYGAIGQAPYLDIPESRRPTEEVARTLGYL